MIIGSITENNKIEKRAAIIPDVVNKYKNLGFEIHLIENYANHLGYEDKFYIDAGAKIVKDEKQLITNSDILIQIGLLNENQLLLMKQNQILVGSLNVHENSLQNRFGNELYPYIAFFLDFTSKMSPK